MKKALLIIMLVAGLFIFQGTSTAGTVDLITNGDFSGGLSGWSSWSTAGGSIDTTGGTLNWSHYGGSNGNAAGATQYLNLDISGYDSLTFKYKVSPTYQTLAAPGWVGGNEYPAVAVLKYTDTSNNAGYIATGYYYSWGGWSTSIDHVYVGQGDWYSYTSPNLFSLCPTIKTIDYVDIYGSGWSYSGSADDVQLLASTRNTVPEPASMLLLGFGLAALAGARKLER